MDLPSLDLDLATEYAWAAWSAVGVDGWRPDSFVACVDLESLLLLTASLGDRDPRLRDGALAWSASNTQMLSRSRLGNLLKRWPESEGWSPMAGRLEAATDVRWPGSSERIDYAGDTRGTEAIAEGPAGLALRLRGLVGTTARSEILRTLLLASPPTGMPARALAQEAAFSKPTLAEAIGGLRLAGVVESETIGNHQQHRLAAPQVLIDLVGPIPSVRLSQRLLAHAAASLIQIDSSRLADAPASVRKVEAVRLLDQFLLILQGAPDRAPIPDGARTSLAGAARWVESQMRAALGQES